MENIQIRLKEIRKKLGLTQVEISNRLGMKQATYQKLESGKTPDMRISTLVHICKTLNVSADDILGLKVNVEEPKTQYTKEFDTVILQDRTEMLQRFEEILSTLDGQDYELKVDFQEPITANDLIKNKPIMLITERKPSDKQTAV